MKITKQQVRNFASTVAVRTASVATGAVIGVVVAAAIIEAPISFAIGGLVGAYCLHTRKQRAPKPGKFIEPRVAT